MSSQVWRLVHDAAVVVFLGNIVTGLFWAAHARRTRDLRVVAVVFDGLTRSDSRIALPCVPVILVSGVALAGRAHLPLLGTGWILWASVSFAVSGVLFALRVGPLQESIAALARRGGNDDGTWNAVSGVYRRWMAHAVLSIAAATIPLGLMVLKPSLPRMTRPAAVTRSSDDSGPIVASVTSAGAVPILLIYRETLREGAADRYHRLEEDAAAMCRSLRCPNPYLATESLDTPTEVWFLNGFRSATHEQAVARAYTRDRALAAALERISTSKASLTHAPVTVRTTLLESTHAPTPWRLGEGRFLVVATAGASARSATYIADDGSRFVLTGAQTEGEARQMATRGGPEARVFAVRPRMSAPSQEWVDGDPTFWRGDPPR